MRGSSLCSWSAMSIKMTVSKSLKDMVQCFLIMAFGQRVGCRVMKKVKTTFRGTGADRKKHDSSFQKWILRHLHAGCEAGNERRRHDLHDTIALKESQQERYTRNQHRSIRNCKRKLQEERFWAVARTKRDS